MRSIIGIQTVDATAKCTTCGSQMRAVRRPDPNHLAPADPRGDLSYLTGGLVSSPSLAGAIGLASVTGEAHPKVDLPRSLAARKTPR
jgi:hypothetical protein